MTGPLPRKTELQQDQAAAIHGDVAVAVAGLWQLDVDGHRPMVRGKRAVRYQTEQRLRVRKPEDLSSGELQAGRGEYIVGPQVARTAKCGRVVRRITGVRIVCATLQGRGLRSAGADGSRRSVDPLAGE